MRYTKFRKRSNQYDWNSFDEQKRLDEIEKMYEQRFKEQDELTSEQAAQEAAVQINDKITKVKDDGTYNENEEHTFMIIDEVPDEEKISDEKLDFHEIDMKEILYAVSIGMKAHTYRTKTTNIGTPENPKIRLRGHFIAGYRDKEEDDKKCIEVGFYLYQQNTYVIRHVNTLQRESCRELGLDESIHIAGKKVSMDGFESFEQFNEELQKEYDGIADAWHSGNFSSIGDKGPITYGAAYYRGLQRAASRKSSDETETNDDLSDYCTFA